MRRFLISATHKSSGKTTLAIGICAALTARGMTVQPFKKGPDYIDPLWLSQAAQRACYSLDPYLMNPQEIVNCVAQHPADLGLIEGNLGLFDSIDTAGNYSNATLAKLLNVPVILVIDTQGMSRGIAPLLLGYQMFESEVRIAGVILNKVAGHRHEGKLRASVAHYTNLPVLGAIHRDAQIEITERHLGLMPSNEDVQAQIKIKTLAQRVAEYIDLDMLLEIAKQTTPLPTIRVEASDNSVTDVKIGVIRDAAFGFYYPSDLVALENAGAKLVFLNALYDTQLPTLDALFIGGGFPETQMEKLASNETFKRSVRLAIEQAMPVYAECGGLMYLAQQITWQTKTCKMVGALPFKVEMQTRPQGRGYIHLRETGRGLWPLQETQSAEFYAHEFHYSKVVDLPTHLPFAYHVLRGTGLDGQHDGIIYKNTLACYAHLRDVENNRWTRRFVNFTRQSKKLKDHAYI